MGEESYECGFVFLLGTIALRVAKGLKRKDLQSDMLVPFGPPQQLPEDSSVQASHGEPAGNGSLIVLSDLSLTMHGFPGLRAGVRAQLVLDGCGDARRRVRPEPAGAVSGLPAALVRAQALHHGDGPRGGVDGGRSLGLPPLR
ncbi:hypothetical protein VaNZ11_007866 [Volvox africanus]|uniref:Uncharacterized protein n=1 Tax=Volvox africanus TaxID=51714 RepID=A0ABQ5S3R5_9CHLO|nr:hypothetical protein VaNZ11_007866 [Volvox africanus]